MASRTSNKNKDMQKKSKSKEAARSRRGQQNDEFQELSRQLPLPDVISNQLDRLCIMRLTNSYIKIKKLLESMMNSDPRQMHKMNLKKSSVYDKEALEAMDGFLYVVAPDGQCLYVSENISHYMGLSQIEVTGNSLYKYVHPCDHEELANQLGGQIPLEDMEIFDGLFCSDSVFMMSNYLKKGSKKQDTISPHRSFFLRMKSTLTSRGKSVNLRASTYRVIHCTGSMKYTTCYGSDGKEEKVPLFLVAIAVPLMFASTFEVPLDRGTFTSRHMLDMKFLHCDEKATSLLGYSQKELIGKSWYNFHHAADLDNVLNTHKLLLTKGQSVSKYYRFLVRDGGWVWVQTKAHVVYDSKTCQPQFVFCINYVLGGKQSAMSFLSTEQTCPLPLTADLKDILKGQNQVLKTEKDDIVFEERTKLLKNGSKKEMINVKQEPSSKGCQDTNDTEPSESMDCDSISFEDCFRLAWDDVIQQQDDYHKHTWDYYGIDSLPKDQIVEDTSQPSEMDESLFLPSPNTAKVTENVKEEPIEELDMHRAPFIPPPSTDAGLTCEDTDILTEISLDEPPCWLDGNGIQTSYLTPGTTGKLQSLSTVNSPVMPRKVPESVKRNGYITNDLLTTGKVCLPSIAQFDVEVNAPLYSCKLLGGNELLKALDVDMLDANT